MRTSGRADTAGATLTERFHERFGDGERLYDRIYHMGLASLCAVVFAIMLYLASGSSLWLDEIFQVEYCRSSTFVGIITIDPYTPPLFNAIAWCWYRLVPFGEAWLRLPCIALVVASLPIVAMTGRRLSNRRTGFIAAFLLAINAKVFTQMGLTFRAYALLLFLSALVVYLYVRRVQTPFGKFSWKISVAYGLAMLALGYTHYFGVLLCCVFFLVDLYLALRGRLRGIVGKVLLSYGIALVGYVPWLGVAFGTYLTATGAGALDDSAVSSVSQWREQGLDTNVHGLLYWLCGECAETLGLFHVAAIIIIVIAVYRCTRREFKWQEEVPLVAMLVAVGLVTGVMWAYANFVNPNSMFWVDRYFTPLVPCITLVCAWGVDKIFSWMPTNRPAKFVAGFLCVALLVPTAVGTIHNDMAEGSSTRFYSKLAAWLEERPGISSDKTVVLALINTTDRGRQISGWKHYYFDVKDTREFQVNIWDGLDPSVIVNPYDLLQFDTIYVTRQHFYPDLPESYEELFRRYYKKHSTENPGWGETTYYTRVR